MSQYRIVEIFNGKQTHYEVEKKGWFLWWTVGNHWSSTTEFGNGFMTTEFKTCYEAEKYIKQRIEMENELKERPPSYRKIITSCRDK